MDNPKPKEEMIMQRPKRSIEELIKEIEAEQAAASDTE